MRRNPFCPRVETLEDRTALSAVVLLDGPDTSVSDIRHQATVNPVRQIGHAQTDAEAIRPSADILDLNRPALNQKGDPLDPALHLPRPQGQFDLPNKVTPRFGGGQDH